MEIVLDGRMMRDKASAHDYLKQILLLPDYYGRNLDALYDLLTERSEPLTITVQYTAEMTAQLGNYGMAFIETLKDAAEQRPDLTLRFE